MKYYSPLFLTATFVILGISAMGAHDFVVDGIAYNVENDHAVVTYKGNYSSNTYSQMEINIPETVSYKDIDYPVTAIGRYAFNSCGVPQSITIPSSITEIREGAFSKCAGLVSMVIPESVETIGKYAFQDCNITTLSISCREIGENAFSGLRRLEKIEGQDATADGRCLIIDGRLRLFAPTGISDYDLPESIEVIDDGIFSNMSQLENIHLPSSTKTIGSKAFHYCSSLKRINIPASTTEIGSSAFWGCNSLREIEVEDMGRYCHVSVPSSAGLAFFSQQFDFVNPSGEVISDLCIPSDVAIVSNCLFRNSTIQSVKIEEGVREISNDAFRDCKHLRSVEIPSSISKIGNAAFRDCYRLSSLNYGAVNPTAGYHVKEDRDDEHSYIFTGCSSLTNVKLLDSVKEIPDYLFAQSYLKSIRFPESVEKVGNDIFYLGKLETACFEGSFMELGKVFGNCPQLSAVKMASANPPVVTAASLGSVSNAALYVPEASIASYSAAEGWSSFKNISTEPAAGTVGHSFAAGNLRYEIVDYDQKLCKVVSPSIGEEYAGEITIPETVLSESGEPFTVISIDAYAFTYSSKVTSIKIPDTISVISGIDNSTSGLEQIVVEASHPNYTTIDGVLFDKDVSEIILYPSGKRGAYTVPSSVENIGNMLAAKIELEELIIPDNIGGTLSMDKSPSLKSLKTGNGITGFSVADCPALEYLEIGAGVKSIRGENFGAGYHDLWTTTNIRTLIFADSPDPIDIYVMSVDDGYIEAIPTSKCQYLYIGRDLRACGSPTWNHFSGNVPHVEFGPEVTRLDIRLIKCMYATKQISVPSIEFWVSTPRLMTGGLPNYSLYVDGKPAKDITISSGNIIASALDGANNIETITLTGNVKTIGNMALNTYPALKSLTVNHTDPNDIPLTSNPLSRYEEVTLIVPAGSKDLYRNADYWKYFTNIIEDVITSAELTETDDADSTIEYFDLHGYRVDPAKISHGIYIIRRSNGKTSKVVL